MANNTLETIRNLKFELLEYPPYSPDHASSDFGMSGPLKERLGGSFFERRVSEKFDAFVVGRATQNVYVHRNHGVG